MSRGSQGSVNGLPEYLLKESELISRLKPDSGARTGLRFDLPFLSVSTLAEQYFCEKKVEFEYAFGRVETESKQQGSEGHEALLEGTIQSGREEILSKIFSGETVLVHELSFVAEIRSTLLAGVPDAIIFQGGVPLILFEFKFSNSSSPYPSYHVQAEVYCAMLESLGFDVSNLFYALAIIPRNLRNEDSIFQNIFAVVAKNGPKEAKLTASNSEVYVYKYEHAKAEMDLNWALGYWENEREATPTTNGNKCRSCEFLAQCRASS